MLPSSLQSDFLKPDSNRKTIRQIVDACLISATHAAAPKRCSVLLLNKFFVFTTTFKLFGAEICVAEKQQVATF
jgi:hypothetical protein